MTSEQEEPILHVLVVGFHHKKGCLVEYAYPPLVAGEPVNSNELPEPWKHLPSVALPDGAHNYEQDAIYFHLPSLDNPRKTIYGISCYRQMNAEHLLNRSSDITRGTVQKSVCVLSTLPLYGLIQAKLELITHAYFSERDFSKVTLLEETFKNLNSSLTKDMLEGQQAFLGLSARDLVLKFKHKTLMLFKLLLLERKVLFYKSPVKDLCSTVLTLSSLFPGMIEKGLGEAATSISSKLSSPELRLSNEHDYMEVHYKENNNDVSLGAAVSETSQCLHSQCTKNGDSRFISTTHTKENLKDIENSNYSYSIVDFSSSKFDKTDNPESDQDDKYSSHKSNSNDFNQSGIVGKRASQSSCDTDNESWENIDSLDMGGDNVACSTLCKETKNTIAEEKVHNNDTLDEEDRLLHEIDELLDSDDKEKVLNHSTLEFQENISSKQDIKDTSIVKNMNSLVKDGYSSLMSSLRTSKSTVLSGTAAAKVSAESDENRRWSLSNPENQLKELDSPAPPLLSTACLLKIELDDCGLPLAIFTKGALCHPYLSLPYLDLLNDVNVRSFVAGATNVLFKQKKHLFDVIVEIDDAKVDAVDIELRKQLHLTTEDLRFADHLVRHVSEDSRDVFLDGTGWEGGDEWVRAQFKLYLLSLLRTSQIEVSGRECEVFNPSFMAAWKTTHNYKMWSSGSHKGVLEVNPGHPFQGQLSVSDMKLRISHTMQSSDRGRRLNQAVVSTGKVVAQTGKAVGGALTTAKSVVSSWWSHLGTYPQQLQEEQQASTNKHESDDFQQFQEMSQ